MQLQVAILVSLKTGKIKLKWGLAPKIIVSAPVSFWVF